VERWIDRMIGEEVVHRGTIQPEWVRAARTVSDPPDNLRE
jgi:hypothetical protein